MDTNEPRQQPDFRASQKTAVDALDQIIANWTPKATAGDPDAAYLVIKAIETQARVFGL